jgi:hypothetical protein
VGGGGGIETASGGNEEDEEELMVNQWRGEGVAGMLGSIGEDCKRKAR